MSFRTATRTRLGAIREYPIDLAVVSLAAAVAYAVITTQPAGSSLRLLATLPLVCVLPGYALVSLLFPAEKRGGDAARSAEDDGRRRGIDGLERLGLAIALSLAIVPLLVLVLPWTEWGFQTASTTAGLAAVTIVFAQFGVVRRLRIPTAKRVTFSPLSTVDRLRNGEPIRLSAVVLVVAIGVAAGALVLAFLAPASAGGFTELGLYSENEDGDLVAGELPATVAPGEPVETVIAIDNEEGDDREYTLLIQQQTVEDGGVVDRTTGAPIEAGVSDGERWTSEQAITPIAEPNETVRMSVLLYDDEPPAEPTNENALEDTYFWVTVAE